MGPLALLGIGPSSLQELLPRGGQKVLDRIDDTGGAFLHILGFQTAQGMLDHRDRQRGKPECHSLCGAERQKLG